MGQYSVNAEAQKRLLNYLDTTILPYADVATLKETVIASLGEFLDVFNSIGDCDDNLFPQEVICISDDTKKQILKNAKNSFANMETSLPATLNRDLPIQDAIFFWALKDSLWQIGKSHNT